MKTPWGKVQHTTPVASGIVFLETASHGGYYLTPDQAHLQRLLTAIRLNCPLSELPAQAPAPPGAHFTLPDEMARRLAAYPEALAATDSTLAIISSTAAED